MKFDREFFTSPTGQVLLVGVVLLLGVFAVRWQHAPRPAITMAPARPAPAVPLPKTLNREGAKFAKPSPLPTAPVANAPASSTGTGPQPKPRGLPLMLTALPAQVSTTPPMPVAPYGRLVPCETVIALESNRLETPIVGLVTEDVWHAGRIVIPAGAEVHGKALLDRARERLAAQPAWRIVWRTPDADNGSELATDGIVLDREVDADHGAWSEHDGSAGLRGQVVRTESDRELKLFAATFLATATASLQDARPTAGLLGESSVPASTARNAILAGTGAVLRDYAQELRAAIARDGFYLRVPAGKSFYLYVTQTLDRSQARRASPLASAPAPSRP